MTRSAAITGTIKNNGNGQGDKTGVRNWQAWVIRRSLAWES
jgi:hypothetical protein